MQLVQSPLAIVAVIIGCVACPQAHADNAIGPGSYTVPDQLPHGVYTANVDMRDFQPGCSFSTWTSDGKFLYGDNALPGKSLTADLSAPSVAKFITHGCTPWTRQS